MMRTATCNGRRRLLPLLTLLAALTAAPLLGQDAPLTAPNPTDPPKIDAPAKPETPAPEQDTPAPPATYDEVVAYIKTENLDQPLREKIDGAFGHIVGYIAPVLFFDATRGVFDPSAETVDKHLVDAESRLAAATASEDQAAIKSAKREVAKLTSWKQTLAAKTEAQASLAASSKELDANLARAAAEKVAFADGLFHGRIDAILAAGTKLDDKGYVAARRDLRDFLAMSDSEKAAYADKQFEARHAAIEAQADATIHSVPLIILFLLGGGIFFTLRYGFINIRLFTHSVAVIRGKYDNPDDHGEISHFQALTSALSATVGLGNIAGVAIAISMGGAGAVFWMWVVAFFGMSSKFSSCTLAQVYRRISPESKDHGSADADHPAEGRNVHVLGGPMVYLTEGMKDVFGKAIGAPIGRTLAILFAFFAICGSLGGGNMFQGNQTFALFGDIVFQQSIDGEDALIERVENGDAAAAKELRTKRAAATKDKEANKKKYAWVGGLVLMILVGIVIVGGIKRIGEVTSKLVPAMCLFYVGVCAVIVFANPGEIPAMIGSIFAGAFSNEAIGWGGLMGVLVIGVQRGAFSNEAGLGSAAIAHSAAKTKEPVREGVVAMIGPFIDTIVVCTMTALAILITESHTAAVSEGFANKGVGITAAAFSQLAPQLSYLLSIAVFIFAYSTMISWSYYGERASEYLFGHAGIWPFRIVFLLFVFMGPMVSLGNVIDFTDLLILSMAYPNILGMIFLSKKVAGLAKDYAGRLKSGEMKPVK